MFSSKKLIFTQSVSLGRIRIIQQPVSTTAVNLSASFTVVAEHLDGLEMSYRWQELFNSEWVDIFPDMSGQSATYSIITASYEMDGKIVRVVISSADGSVAVSDSATLTVPPAPISITQQPVNKLVDVGGTANFSCLAEHTSGGTIDSYEWQVWEGGPHWYIDWASGSPVGTTPALEFQALLEMDGWKFRCVVSSNADYAISDEATLSVEDLPDLRMMSSAKKVVVSEGRYSGDFRVSAGSSYTFDVSDPSNRDFPMRFSLTPDGVHGGGRQYAEGVLVTGTPGMPGASVRIDMPSEPTEIYYYCHNHPGMGGILGSNLNLTTAPPVRSERRISTRG